MDIQAHGSVVPLAQAMACEAFWSRPEAPQGTRTQTIGLMPMVVERPASVEGSTWKTNAAEAAQAAGGSPPGPELRLRQQGPRRGR